MDARQAKSFTSSMSKVLVIAMVVGVLQFGLASTESHSAVQEVPRIGYIGLRPINETAASMASITALKDGLRELCAPSEFPQPRTLRRSLRDFEGTR